MRSRRDAEGSVQFDVLQRWFNTYRAGGFGVALLIATILSSTAASTQPMEAGMLSHESRLPRAGEIPARASRLELVSLFQLALPERLEEVWDDSRILVTAKAVLFNQKALPSKYLRVRVSKGVLFLDGFIRRPEEEALARKKLTDIKGVNKIVMRCVVIKDLGAKHEYETRFTEPAEDLILATKIRAALLGAAAEKHLPWQIKIISVDVFKGDVTVYAIVPGATDSEKIAAIARGVPGVKTCDVKVCPPAKEDEAER